MRSAQPFHPSWLRAPELLANETAIGSVNRVLESIDRMEAHNAQIDAALAEYRAIGNPAPAVSQIINRPPLSRED